MLINIPHLRFLLYFLADPRGTTGIENCHSAEYICNNKLVKSENYNNLNRNPRIFKKDYPSLVLTQKPSWSYL